MLRPRRQQTDFRDDFSDPWRPQALWPRVFATFPSRWRMSVYSFSLKFHPGPGVPVGKGLGKGDKEKCFFVSLMPNKHLVQCLWQEGTSKHKYTCPEELWVGRDFSKWWPGGGRRLRVGGHSWSCLGHGPPNPRGNQHGRVPLESTPGQLTSLTGPKCLSRGFQATDLSSGCLRHLG